MKIGLVRHFKVDCRKYKRMSSSDYNKWVETYDISPVIENPVDLSGVQWSKCYASDLPRAVTTAETILKANNLDLDIIKTEFLREIPASAAFRTSYKFSHNFWSISSRVAWLISHKSQPERRTDTLNRVKKILDEVEKESDKDTLLVCHAMIIQTLQQELKRRGFKGKYIRFAKNGQLCVWEK